MPVKESFSDELSLVHNQQVSMLSTAILRDRESISSKYFYEFLDFVNEISNRNIDETEIIESISMTMITNRLSRMIFGSAVYSSDNAFSKISYLAGLFSECKVDGYLQLFYEFYGNKIYGVKNKQERQLLITELYGSVVRACLPRKASKLGVVYTPIEIVDFIANSIADILKYELGFGETSNNKCFIIDPFAGVGTFGAMAIENKRLGEYKCSLEANEIMLFPYCIAVANISKTIVDSDEGGEETKSIFLVDTFLTSAPKTIGQTATRIVMGNPPYSGGQESANDNLENDVYPEIDARIAKTYVAKATTTMHKASYDSYIRSFRWATDYINSGNNGVVAFVSNGGWLEGNTHSGFRRVIASDFNNIFVINLRGNQRSSGERSREEGGKIFGSESRAGVTITFLIKNEEKQAQGALIKYIDIGGYLPREEKLAMIHEMSSIMSGNINWETIIPDENGDWINKGTEIFWKFIPLADKTSRESCFFNINSNGIVTNRDAWSYNSSKEKLIHNINKMINFYNKEKDKFIIAARRDSSLKAKEFVSTDPTSIKWVQNLYKDAQMGVGISFEKDKMSLSSYRPFLKQHMYRQKNMVWSQYLQDSIFPTSESSNMLIVTTGAGNIHNFSCLMTDAVPDLQYQFNGQCFPLYVYNRKSNGSIVKRSGVSGFIMNLSRGMHGQHVSEEDVFYYVYGILHSKEFREKFRNDLKKMIPRIPMISDTGVFFEVSGIGRELAQLHTDYEIARHNPYVVVSGIESNNFVIEKPMFLRRKVSGKTLVDKSVIIYNDEITISEIPLIAYEYVVNGRSAIEWFIEKYRVKTDEKSGIKNDINDLAVEFGDRKYALNVILNIIYISIETANAVERLPDIDF